MLPTTRLTRMLAITTSQKDKNDDKSHENNDAL